METSPSSMPTQGVTPKSPTLLQQNPPDLLRSTPRLELKTTEETSDNDPDYNLKQYHMRRVTSPSGFVYYLNERDIMDVPVHKRDKVQALLEAERLAYLASQDSESSKGEDCGGPMTQRTSMAPPLGPTLWDIFEERKRNAERTYSSVKAVYFMYKFGRNQWRSTLTGKNPDLSDIAYRKQKGLPKYSLKETRLMQSTLSVTSERMPRFCESRARPYNLWTLEEKVAWVDRSKLEEKWTWENTQEVAAYWNSKTPGELKYQRAVKLMEQGHVLTERQKDVIKYSIQQRQKDQDQLEAKQLEEALSTVEAQGTADPFEHDCREENRLQAKAVRDTQEALFKWQERERQLRRTVLLDDNHLTEC